mmetsp:Transcript_3195/g.4495  ORF Transcript_3195/g.4495 Transcript_3195/m.4495 type:complete len:823 (-) Transcript_3195:159-2627(-)
MSQHQHSYRRRNNIMMAFVIASLASAFCLKPVAAGDIDILKTGDYEDTSFAEPHKITELSLVTEDGVDLANFSDVKWNVVFVPVEDEIWPDYLQEVLAEEVAGYSIAVPINEHTHLFSHTFTLPGNYKVSAIGSKPARRMSRQMESQKEKATKAPKQTKAPKETKAPKQTKAPKETKAPKQTKAPKETKAPKCEKTGSCDENNLFELASSNIRVRYARRDVIDLSPSDWDKYVEAVWTLKELSSEEGQRRFDCPNFYNIDVFTAMHGSLSHDSRCDQNHFSLMQENAHHAWMTLLEKALQCVHASIAMPFYNVAKDKRKYFDPTIGARSMLDSPIFGPDYYGGGSANFDDRDDLYDPYYVEDGRFANFPLRQNRTELCDESKGLFDDDTYIPLCKSILEEGAYKGWRNDDPTKSGLLVHEPRDDDSYKYVSARRWHIYGDVGDILMPNVVPSHEMVNAMTSTRDVTEQFKYVASPKVHGYAHKLMSGMWGGGIDESTLIPPTSQLNKGVPILETFRRKSGLLVAFAWTDELSTRQAGCYQCTKEGCTVNFQIATEKNCYNINNNFGVPQDRTQPVWSEYAVEGNQWYKFLEQMNQASWMKFALYGYGTYHANSGTFGRHEWANQDPIFYVHHAFTFLLNDFGFSKLVEERGEVPPLYGIDRVLEARGVPECPGHNPKDVAVYKNIVRYKTGQEVGEYQTWEHMLDMWSEGRRDYEWVINDEFITNYDETIRYDDSCVDGCVDEALIILNDYRGIDITLEEMCQDFVGKLQNSNNISKEEACAYQLKDIPALGFPFLPSQFDLFSYSCKKTCGFCSNTCGDIE